MVPMTDMTRGLHWSFKIIPICSTQLQTLGSCTKQHVMTWVPASFIHFLSNGKGASW